MSKSQLIRLAALAAFAGVQTMNAQVGDPRSKLAGTYVFAESGSSNGQRVSGVGLLKLDASGGISGWQMIRASNLNQVSKIDGTFAVDADGCGTLNLSHTIAPPPGQEEEAAISAQYKFVSLNDRNGGLELRAIRAENGLAVSSTLVRAAAEVSVASLKGTYVLAEHGVLGTSDMSAIGRVTFDGKGNVSGWEVTRSRNFSADATIEGSYGIAQDGSGNMTLTHTLPEPLTLNDASSYPEQYKIFVVGGPGAQKPLIALRVENGVVCVATLTPQ